MHLAVVRGPNGVFRFVTRMNEVPELAASAKIFEGPVFSVRVDQIRYDDGKLHRMDIVEHRGSYAIVATTSEDRIVLVRQYRHPAQRLLWEIPAGVAQDHETADQGAARELREETGYIANSMRALGSMFVTPGFCTEQLHFFHATDLTPGEQHLDPDERITVASYTIDEAQSLLHTGQISDVKTVLALLWMNGSRGQLVNHNGR